MDRKTFRQKFALRLAGHPVTILPLLGGATALCLGWAVSAPSAMFAGVAGIVIAAGALVTRAGFLGKQIAQQLNSELQEQEHLNTEAALDRFRAKLASDNDTRDERLLDQLRELVRAFKRNSTWASRVNPVSVAEISGGVEELFRACVKKLDDAFELLGTARTSPVSAVRRALEQQRKQILDEVEASAEQLAELLTSVYTLGTGSDVRRATTDVQGQLQRSLEVARRVDEQMHPKDSGAAVRAAMRQRRKEPPT